MTTIAIIGAGPGLGVAVARRFGREGFDVALITRTTDRARTLSAELAGEGLTARGFAADVRDLKALEAALDAATATLGPIEVMQYSPVPQREFMRPVLETTPADLVGPIEFSVYGPVAAVHQVLPGMRALGRGTILFVNGGTAAVPHPDRVAPPSPSPPRAPTDTCCTARSPTRASTSRNSSSPGRSAPDTPGRTPPRSRRPSGTSTGTGTATGTSPTTSTPEGRGPSSPHDLSTTLDIA